MSKLINAIVPNFPKDRNVKATMDKVSWYKIIHSTSTLMVPPENVLKVNMLELDKFIEAIKSFAVTPLDAPEYDWVNIHTESYNGWGCWEGINRIKSFLHFGGYVSVDIEARRVEWEDNRLLAIGFAVNPQHSIALYNIPEDVFPVLQSIFDRTDVQFIWHNGKFDCGRLKYLCNLTARVDEDTMLQHFAQINEKRGTHGLKDLGQLYLQAPAWDDELDSIKREWCKVNKKKLSEFMYDDIPTDVLIPYLHKDCIATFRLNQKFRELARPGSDFIYRKLIEASAAFLEIELTGMKLDLAYMEELGYILDEEIDKASGHLTEVSELIWDPQKYVEDTGAKTAPSTFNPNSPKQLKWMLQRVLGYPVPSTDAILMQSLLDEVEAGVITAPLAKEFIESIGTLRKQSKYKNTYVAGMKNVVCRDGRIRSTFNLHGTETGRLSSSNPNMQNIPRNKMIKNLIVAADGYRLVQLDYSQAELRVLAMLSEDPWLIQTYKDGKDLHDAVSIQMFGEGFDKEQRNLAKTINFGIAYGRGPSSLAEKFGVSMNEARGIVEKWFKPMPGVRAFIDARRRMPLKGEPCTTMFGRERHFVITNEGLNHIQNEYINTPIQSIASDLTLFSLIEINKRLKEMKVDARIIISVHDSIILEVRDYEPLIAEIAVMGAEIMAEIPLKYMPECKVPFKADVETGYKWGEMSKWGM